jgi:hypothetical protein
LTTGAEKKPFIISTLPIHFFLPLALLSLDLLSLDLLFDAGAGLEAVDMTLEAREGDVEVALLPAADFTLSSALFF